MEMSDESPQIQDISATPLGMRDLTSTKTSAFSECRVKMTGSNLRQVVPAAVTMGPIAVR